MRSIALLLFFLSLTPTLSWGQEEKPTPWWERGDDESEGHWFFRGLMTADFYPFNMNNRRGYESIWGFNATTGGELLYSQEEDPNSYGGGILYSFKDYNQEIRNPDTASGEHVIKASHKIRYVEIPIILQRDFIRNEQNRVYWDAALMPALMDRADSRFDLKNGTNTRSTINDTQFARFLLGVRLGGGYSRQLSESFSVGTGLYTKLYLTDMFKDQHVNFSSIGIRVNLTYHLE